MYIINIVANIIYLFFNIYIMTDIVPLTFVFCEWILKENYCFWGQLR